MEPFETIALEVDSGIARLTLRREREANALDARMARELMIASIRVDEDPSVRAVLLTGKGPMFCAGGDLKAFAAFGDGLPSHIKEVTTYYHAAVSRLSRMRAPLVAAVNGAAAGAGLSLVCMADIAIAASSARFSVAYTKAGLTPDGGLTYFLPRAVGSKRALELTLTNRRLSAEEARALGIVAEVVPDDELAARATAVARDLASGPNEAIAASRRLLASGFTEGLETQLELESRSISAMAGSPDGKEGVAAFCSRRTPKFGA